MSKERYCRKCFLEEQVEYKNIKHLLTKKPAKYEAPMIIPDDSCNLEIKYIDVCSECAAKWFDNPVDNKVYVKYGLRLIKIED